MPLKGARKRANLYKNIFEVPLNEDNKDNYLNRLITSEKILNITATKRKRPFLLENIHKTIIVNEKKKKISDYIDAKITINNEKTSEKIVFDDSMKEKILGKDLMNFKQAGTRCIRIGCKSTNISSVNAQTRSIDEGETVFYTCNVCGKRWRKS